MEQRRTERFKLQFPLAITRSGKKPMALAAQTKNISSTGVLFTSACGPEVGVHIEYVITAPNSLNIACAGKVVRTERIASREDPTFEVAATLERYAFARGFTEALPAVGAAPHPRTVPSCARVGR